MNSNKNRNNLNPTAPLLADLTLRDRLEVGVTPIDASLLHALISRISEHFSYTSIETQAAIDILASYPEDLVCAAYCHVMRLLPDTPYSTLINIMLEMIMPENHFRKTRYQLFANASEDA